MGAGIPIPPVVMNAVALRCERPRGGSERLKNIILPLTPSHFSEVCIGEGRLVSSKLFFRKSRVNHSRLISFWQTPGTSAGGPDILVSLIPGRQIYLQCGSEQKGYAG